MENRPKVGIGVIIVKDKKVLLGKRKGAHGKDTWSFGGGHLEFGETVEECAKREALEETGLKINSIKLGPWTEDIHEEEGKHYITIFTIAEHAGGEPKIMEPEYCEKWEWFDWDKLPRPLFLPIENLLKTGFTPFSDDYK